MPCSRDGKPRQRGSNQHIIYRSTATQPVARPYASSKATLEALSRASAIEFASLGVGINCVALGVTNTEALQETIANEGGITVEMAGKAAPIGRVNKVSEIATVCQLLASGEVAALTGTVITVDGGITAGTYSPMF